MSTIRVSVDGAEHEVNLSPDVMSLREHARLQEQIGHRRYDQFVRTGAIEVRPDFLAAYLFAKLKSSLPELDVDGLDVDFAALVEAFSELAEVDDDEGKA